MKALPDYQDVDQKLDMTGNTSKKGKKIRKLPATSTRRMVTN
jgi:hypothetical protein